MCVGLEYNRKEIKIYSHETRTIGHEQNGNG